MAWGDSLTAYDLLSPNTYPFQLSTLLHKSVLNEGVGGQTSTQIAARMLALPQLYKYPVIIWAGRNDFTTPTTVKTNIASMVAALGHANYLVLSIINRRDTASEMIGGADYATIVQLNSDLAAIYGSRYVDVRRFLVDSYDPNQPQDVIDHANDVPPNSLNSGDGLHLNNAGYQVVAKCVFQNRTPLGV